MTRRMLLVNGPNLNLLGVREPDVYGTDTLDDVIALAEHTAAEFGFELRSVQSNHEGALIDAIHEARTDCEAIVINPGAFTHTSIALRDALSGVALPIAEVHLSNVHSREEFRHHSYISPIAECVIVGAGIQGYEFAVRRLGALLPRAEPHRVAATRPVRQLRHRLWRGRKHVKQLRVVRVHENRKDHRIEQ